MQYNRTVMGSSLVQASLQAGSSVENGSRSKYKGLVTSTIASAEIGYLTF